MDHKQGKVKYGKPRWWDRWMSWRAWRYQLEADQKREARRYWVWAAIYTAVWIVALAVFVFVLKGAR